MNTQSFLEKWRPSRLDQVIGQDEIVAILKAYVANPEPTAFILCGSTGCGKGSAASALCNELGADPYWGVQDIPAGKQTAEAVDEMTRTLWQHCPAGSGWKVVIVNECDQMHPKVNARWCDILENIPPKVCIIFTTNKIAEMTKDDEGRRFVDRCHRLDFRSDWAILDSACCISPSVRTMPTRSCMNSCSSLWIW